jgi:ABC transporter substrate binding protein
MRRAAYYVAKLLRGAQPSDLPVEQVANFEFVLNLKTARAIGIELPTSTPLRFLLYQRRHRQDSHRYGSERTERTDLVAMVSNSESDLGDSLRQILLSS